MSVLTATLLPLPWNDSPEMVTDDAFEMLNEPVIEAPWLPEIVRLLSAAVRA